MQRAAVFRQQQSVEVQVRHVRLYRWVILLSLPLIGFILWLIFKLVGRLFG